MCARSSQASSSFDITLLCRPPEREEKGRGVTMPCKPNVTLSGERCNGGSKRSARAPTGVGVGYVV
jgi:hypothetical protein